MKYKVEALSVYVDKNVTDSELGRIPQEKEQWEVSEERLNVLLGNNPLNEVFVKIVEEITFEDEVVIKKKTTRRKSIK